MEPLPSDIRADRPQYALSNLDPSRIVAARELRGFTRTLLASKIDKTPSAITQFENGTLLPDLATLIRIAQTLEVPTTFFAHKGNRGSTILLDSCHFRSRRSASQRDRRQSVRQGELLIELVKLLTHRGIRFPAENVAKYHRTVTSPEEIEQMATSLRKSWGLGVGPIPHLLRLLESHGIFVLPVYDSCSEVDAYSTWQGGRPYVMLALQKAASRARFDAAHELGHLLFHEDSAPGDAMVERQADRFAGAFIAPREGFIAECPRRWNFEAFRQLKFRWKMSIQACVRRAYDLGCISQASYHRAFQDISKRGMRLDEGPEWEMEQPSMISQALGLLRIQLSMDELASELDIYSSDLQKLLGNCVAQDIIDQLIANNTRTSPNIVQLDRSV